MKALVCEMCSSPNLIKKDGMYVCENCGTRYTVEEARKMMIDGTVDVQGTVKVDNSAFVQKYLANARRAKQKEDWEEVEKYYNMVEQNDPSNIEAIFYSAYGKAKSTLVNADIYKRQAAFKVLKNCISIIDDRYQVNNRAENEIVINNMADDLANMICSEFVYTQKTDGYGFKTDNRTETYTLFSSLLNAFKETIDNIKKIDDQPFLHAASIRLYRVAGLTGIGNWNQVMQTWIDKEQREWFELRRKKFNAYWAEHKEEKMSLDQEKKELMLKIGNLNAQILSLPEVKAEMQIKTKIEALQQKKSGLGFLKGKEKKALQEQIDCLTSNDLVKAKTRSKTAAAPIQVQIDSANTRIAEIDKELSKEH